MTKRRLLLLATIVAGPLLIGWRPAPEGEAPQLVSSSLLLRWQHRVTLGDETRHEYLIYRDGLVVAFGGPIGGPQFYTRGAAEASAMVELGVTLAEHHVGQAIAAGCQGPAIVPTGASYSSVLTWFGKGRQRRLEVGTTGAEPCSSDVDAIVIGVDSFLDSVTNRETVETVP